MLFQRLRERLSADSGFIEPCLPSPAGKPQSGSNWIHEIKHDGFRLWLGAIRPASDSSGIR
jgi:hypothetical protein